MKHNDVRIDEPCSASWSEMSGSERKRFCALCSKHVHDLSAMTEPEAQQVIDSVEEPCVRYTSNPDGTIRFRSSRRVFLSRAGMIAGGLMLGLSAAASVVPREIVEPPSESSLIERLSATLWALLDEAPEPAPEPILMGKPSIDEPSIEQGEVIPKAPRPMMGRIMAPKEPTPAEDTAPPADE